MDAVAAIPTTAAGERYAVRLGETFQPGTRTQYRTVRYNFRPTTVDDTRPGVLVHDDEDRVTMELSPAQEGGAPIRFEGTAERTTECLLLYDPATHSFVLERVDTKYDLSALRVAEAARLVSATVPAHPASPASGLGSGTGSDDEDSGGRGHRVVDDSDADEDEDDAPIVRSGAAKRAALRAPPARRARGARGGRLRGGRLRKAAVVPRVRAITETDNRELDAILNSLTDGDATPDTEE